MGPITTVIFWSFWQFFPLQPLQVSPVGNCHLILLSLQDFQKSSLDCVTAVRKAFQQIKDLCLGGGKKRALQIVPKVSQHSLTQGEKS